MSKCRPDCCSTSSGDGSGVAIIGFIVLAAAAYGILRPIVHAAKAIMHTVIEIVEITALVAGSIAAVALLLFIALRVNRRRRSQAHQAGLKVLAIDLKGSPGAMVASSMSAIDPAQLFAEAVASPDMDPRFVERILWNVMDGTDR